MPRRRSGLTSNARFNATAAGLTAALAVTGCQAGPTDNGCQITSQVVIPGTTALALLTDVRLDRVGGTRVVLGADDTTVRWVTIADDGTVGDEQSVALPDGTFRSWNALAGVDAPGDHIIVGALVPAENGTDAELRLLSAPLDGSPAGDPGAPVVTFGGGVDSPPEIAMGTSASAMYAGVAWIDSARGVMYAFVDGQAALVGDPAATEAAPAPGYSCLGFGPGKDELTISYQRAPEDQLLGPTWFTADVTPDGAISTLALNVSQPGGSASGTSMGCARTAVYDNGGAPEYAIVWQDSSGSWLSVYYGEQVGTVKSFPFASATNFGGADLQPPIAGVATFGKDFGVLFAKAHAAEIWRINQAGNRRSGVLILPSLSGDLGPVTSLAAGGALTSSYADYTGSGEGRRLVIDAVCY
jgi:hypothetical protein